MILGITEFFLAFAYFGQSSTRIEYKNTAYMLKMACTFAFPVVGLYLALFFYAGRKFANQIGGLSVICLLAAYLLGLLLH
jgi:hypothetical protein